MMRLLRLVLIAAFSSSCSAQWPNPLSCNGTCDMTQDPALIQRASDGSWFRFATDEGIVIFTSPSFLGPWTRSGSVLPECSSIQLPGNCDLWAPDVTLVGDTYYLYYSVSLIGSQVSAIGLATSPSLDAGTWTDRGEIMRSNFGDPYNAIDANLLITADGKDLITFGSYFSGIFQTEVSTLTSPADLGDSLAHLALLQGTWIPYIEGAYLFDWNGWYYLFLSHGICCAHNFLVPPPGMEYKIKVCRSKNANTGFVDRDGVDCLNDNGGTIILGSHDNVFSPGGQGVYVVPGFGPVLYYHYVDTRVGLSNEQKLFGVNLLDFGSGWPEVTGTQYTGPPKQIPLAPGSGAPGAPRNDTKKPSAGVKSPSEPSWNFAMCLGLIMILALEGL